MPIGLDSGLDRSAEAVAWGGAPCWQRHRLIFWPRTTTPLVLMTNGREHAPAVYGKIRVLAGGERLPPALPERTAANRRLLAAYLDRPLIPENFSADQCLDAWSGRSLDDWWTFYEGGTRLVEYLNHAGYNGLMLSVLADGSTIYPSKLLAPTPRYDTGVFFATAQDPVRKDVLEMLLRLFDREELQLIPAVEFAAPLPELEAIRRAGGPSAQGIEWIGADGTAWCASSPPQRGLAPYYNVLDPRVQQAMLGVLRELAERYARPPFVCRTGRAAVGRRLRPTARPRLGIGRRDDRPIRARHEAGPAGRGPAALCPAFGLPGPGVQPPGVAGVAGGATGQVLPPRLRGTGRHPARQPALSGRGRHDRRTGTGSRTAAGPAATNQRGRGAAARGHRRPTLSRTIQAGSSCCGPNGFSRKPTSAPAPRTWRSARWPISTATFKPPPARQPVLPPAARSPRRVVRPEEPVQAELHVAGLPAGAGGRAEPAAVRSQSGHARRPGDGRRRLAAADGPGRIDPRPGGRLPRVAADAFPAGGQPAGRRRGPAGHLPQRHATAAEPTSTPSTTPRSPRRRGSTSKPARAAASKS